METSTPAESLLVVCLCAQWCGVCGEYRQRFEQVQAKYPQARFLWVDIEDEADLLDPVDVENFPTVLLAVGREPRFFGVLTPQMETLERLVRAQVADTTASRLVDSTLVALVSRLRSAKCG